MNKEFNENKVAVITGGAKKIGRATAKKLAEQGFNILIHTGGKSIEEAKKTVEIVKEYGVKSNFIDGDLLNLTTINKIKEAAIKLGTPSVLINNAALRINEDFEKITYEDWKKVMTVNVDASFLCAQALIGYMTKQKWGRIISIGGVSARQSTIYGLRNAAVVHMTKTLSDQLGSDGITLNVLHPGLTQTPAIRERMSETAKQQGKTLEEVEAESAKNVAIKRTIKPEELAFVTAVLSSPKAECITGESIAGGGGAIGAVFQ